MRKKKELRFTSEKQEKTKRFRAFIVAFVAFVLVFGSVSTLIFMKRVQTLFIRGRTTTSRKRQTRHFMPMYLT